MFIFLNYVCLFVCLFNFLGICPGVGFLGHMATLGFLGKKKKKYACNAGNPISISGSGKSTGEGIDYSLQYSWASMTTDSVGKESVCNGRDLSSVPGLGRYPGGGHDNPLQYSCLENPHGWRSRAGCSS